MKSSLSILLLAGLLLAGCSQKSADPTAKLLANPVKGMRADELMVARQTGAAVLTARMHQQKDPGMQTVAGQFDQLRKGIDERIQILTATSAGSAPVGAKPQSANVVSPQVRQQQLDSNSSRLLGIIAATRSSVEGIGKTGMVAGLPAESFRAGIRASLDRASQDITRISTETGPKALADLQALRLRLTPSTGTRSRTQMVAPVVRANVMRVVRR